MTSVIDPDRPAGVLGGLTPQQFMRRHWQKKPLVVRSAVLAEPAVLEPEQVIDLAARADVESRLVRQLRGRWQLRSGPFVPSQLPGLGHRGWTLLVQGVDLHLSAAHELMSRFRFLPDARLDDVMVSYATDGGGVGPHVDSYDVFLLQVSGRRRWRIGRVAQPRLVPDLPLKILADFEAEEEHLLDAGDMLYLPPGWGHDGVAEGRCLTASIGFRAASRDEFAREVLQRCLDASSDEAEDAADGAPDGDVGRGPLYGDRAQSATAEPARIPELMQTFAFEAASRLAGDRRRVAASLGEWLSEPKPQVWFESGPSLPGSCDVVLDIRTRMLWDRWHIFINGESYQAAGRDARLMRRLADRRQLSWRERAQLGVEAARLLQDWAEAGWLHARPPEQEAT